MKKNIFFLALFAAALAFISCASNQGTMATEPRSACRDIGLINWKTPAEKKACIRQDEHFCEAFVNKAKPGNKNQWLEFASTAIWGPIASIGGYLLAYYTLDMTYEQSKKSAIATGIIIEAGALGYGSGRKVTRQEGEKENRINACMDRLGWKVGDYMSLRSDEVPKDSVEIFHYTPGPVIVPQSPSKDGGEEK